MNAKSIYDNLIDVQGVPSSILTYSDKEDCIIIEIQDYNKSVFKFAKEFFKGYKSTDIIYTNENKTAIWYNDVSVYSDEETIRAITDFYYRAKVKGLVESKKSIKESINGDCYIYYDDDDGERNVFCDYVKGITDTRSWFYLNEYIIDAIHVFKNEKQAQKFIDEHLKYFADQDKVVIAEYPQTVSGFFELKKFLKESISLETLRNEEHMISEMIDSLKNNKKFNPYEGKYVICCDFFTDKIEFYYLADDVVSYRDIVVGYCNSLKDANSIINELSNKFKFFESNKSARKSIKESKNNFNLWELQKYYPFKKEWENAIKSEGFKIHEISGDKIVFKIDTNKGKFYSKLIKAEEIIEDCMPIFLAKLISWLEFDFGCSWTFGDEDEVDGYQYVDFEIW